MKSIAIQACVRAQEFAPAAVIQRVEPAVHGVLQPALPMGFTRTCCTTSGFAIGK